MFKISVQHKSKVFMCSLVLFLGFQFNAWADDSGFNAISAQPVSPDESRNVLMSASAMKAEAMASATSSPESGTLPSSEADITPEIAALARGFKYDPKLMFDYVQNQIDYTPVFGSINGATITHLNGKGNDWDQA